MLPKRRRCCFVRPTLTFYISCLPACQESVWGNKIHKITEKDFCKCCAGCEQVWLTEQRIQLWTVGPDWLPSDTQVLVVTVTPWKCPHCPQRHGKVSVIGEWGKTPHVWILVWGLCVVLPCLMELLYRKALTVYPPERKIGVRKEQRRIIRSIGL